MNLKIEIEREEDGRWIAEVMELPGCLAYGKTQVDALASGQGARVARAGRPLGARRTGARR